MTACRPAQPGLARRRCRLARPGIRQDSGTGLQGLGLPPDPVRLCPPQARVCTAQTQRATLPGRCIRLTARPSPALPAAGAWVGERRSCHVTQTAGAADPANPALLRALAGRIAAAWIHLAIFAMIDRYNLGRPLRLSAHRRGFCPAPGRKIQVCLCTAIRLRPMGCTGCPSGLPGGPTARPGRPRPDRAARWLPHRPRPATGGPAAPAARSRARRWKRW